MGGPSRDAWIAIGLTAACYLYVFPFFPRINNPNEMVRTYMTAAIVEEGTYAIDSMRLRWGWTIDAAAHNGRHYSVKAPGTSFMGVPAYALYRLGARVVGADHDLSRAVWIVRAGGVILPSLVALFFVYQWLAGLGVPRWAHRGVFVALAVGTPLYAYTLLFVSHAQAALCVLGAFAGIRRFATESSPSRLGFFWAGCLAAAVTMFEYPGFVLSLLLVGYGVWRARGDVRLVFFLLGAALPTLLVMHFQWAAYGNPFSPGHLMLETDTLRSYHEHGLYGLGWPSWAALYGLLVQPGKGLLALSPALFFAGVGLVALVRARSTRVEGVWLASSIVLFTLAIAGQAYWQAGWSVGPRLLTPVVGLLVFPTVRGVSVAAARLPRATPPVFVAMVIVGVVFCGWYSAVYPHIPNEVERPTFEFFAIALAHDFAPMNGGNLVGLWGTLSLIPWAAAVIALTTFALAGPHWLRPQTAFVVVAALGLAFCLELSARKGPAAPRGLAHSLRHWTPEGHDVAARLASELEVHPSPALRQELERTYRVEGRYREARRLSSP